MQCANDTVPRGGEYLLGREDLRTVRTPSSASSTTVARRGRHALPGRRPSDTCDVATCSRARTTSAARAHRRRLELRYTARSTCTESAAGDFDREDRELRQPVHVDADTDGCDFTAETCTHAGDGRAPARQHVDAVRHRRGNGPTSHYGGSTCSQLQGNTFTAAAPDMLFAIDVPAEDGHDSERCSTPPASTPAARRVGGVLTSCADSSGSAPPRRVLTIAQAASYANESDNPVRIYVTVDADGACDHGHVRGRGRFAQVRVRRRQARRQRSVRRRQRRSDDGCPTSCKPERGSVHRGPARRSARAGRTEPCAVTSIVPGTPPAERGHLLHAAPECGVALDLGLGAGCTRWRPGAADSECPGQTATCSARPEAHGLLQAGGPGVRPASTTAASAATNGPNHGLQWRTALPGSCSRVRSPRWLHAVDLSATDRPRTRGARCSVGLTSAFAVMTFGVSSPAMRIAFTHNLQLLRRGRSRVRHAETVAV